MGAGCKQNTISILQELWPHSRYIYKDQENISIEN